MTVQIARVVVQVAEVEVVGSNALEVRAFVGRHLDGDRIGMFPLDWQTERVVSEPKIHQILKAS